MASLFRKIGANLAPAFRKLPSDVSTIGRKITNTAFAVDKGLAKAEKVASQIDKFAPNPLTKVVKGGIGGARDLALATATGGEAIRAGARGDVQGAVNLARYALQKGTEGVGEVAGAGLSAVALL